MMYLYSTYPCAEGAPRDLELCFVHYCIPRV